MKLLVPVNPPAPYLSSERDSYQRRPMLFAFTSNTVTWRWAWALGGPDGMTTPTPLPQIRLVIDQIPTIWIAPTDGKNQYDITLYIEDGHHVVWAEAESVFFQYESLAKGFIVNASGQPLPEQKPWTSGNRFERFSYKSLGAGVAQVEYDYARPAPVGLKPRELKTMTTRAAKQDLWVRRPSTTMNPGMVRRFVKTVTGDVVIEEDQKYFYSDLFNGLDVPTPTRRDGDRGWGVHAFVVKGLMSPARPVPPGMYWVDAVGSVGFTWLEGRSAGRVVTLAGWRQKGDLRYHGYTRLTHPKLREEDWENVGDWSLVSGVKRFNEPWGIIAKETPDHPGGYHEFWVCDSGNHRILYLNHFTAHAHDNFAHPSWAPNDTPMPEHPTGQTQLVDFLTVDMLVAQGFEPDVAARMLNMPWDCAERDGFLYWTSFGGAMVCRADIKTREAEIVVASATNPTDAQMAFSRFHYFPTASRVDYARQVAHQDGAFGEARFARPQSIAFDSQGKLLVACRATYVLMEIDLAAATVKTVVPLKGYGFNYQDVTFCVDTEGTFGPKDDIFVAAFQNLSTQRYGRDGTSYGNFFPLGPGMIGSCRGGDLREVGYPWAPVVGAGKLVCMGHAAGWMLLDVTRRLPDDPVPNLSLWQAGRDAYHFSSLPGGAPMALTHGPFGQGEIGFPTIDEMGAWSDDAIRSYAAAYMPADKLDAFLYFVRQQCCDNDYSEVEMPKDISITCHAMNLDAGDDWTVEVTLRKGGVVKATNTSDAFVVAADPPATPVVHEPVVTVE